VQYATTVKIKITKITKKTKLNENKNKMKPEKSKNQNQNPKANPPKNLIITRFNIN